MSQEKKDNKLLYFGTTVREDLEKGFKSVYKAVTKTYGPKGTNVLIEKTYGRPILTRDGVTVAREVYFSDRSKNMGAQLIVEASQTTNRIAGDGTTATVALTYWLYKLAAEQIAAGKNPMDLRTQILEDSYKILDRLTDLSLPVKKGQLKQVASVSSGDPLLGRLIAEAVEHVGSDGGIITEKAPISDIDREYVEGYYLQQGFPAIEMGKKSLDNPYVVVSSKTMTSAIDALELIQKIALLAHQEQGIENPQAPLNQPLRIAFFGEIEGDAYNTIVANIQKGAFDGVVVKTPPMGDMGVQYLEDLAVYTGGKVISQGQSIGEINTDYIGKAGKVTSTVSDTIIFEGEHAKEDLAVRIAEIKDRLKVEEIDALAEKLRDRIAKLENKIARFRIGGATETEKEEKEFRIEDAIQSTRAAASQGVVPGGGSTLLALSTTEGISPLFKDALQNVFKRLLKNANLPAEVKLNEALPAPIGEGFNLRKSDKLVDLVKEGILDPTLVLEQIIKNSASAAGNAITTDCIITFENKDD